MPCSKNISKSIGRSLSGKKRQKHLDHAKTSTTDALETTSKTSVQEPAEVIWLEVKLLIKLHRSHKIHHKTVQIRLKMRLQI